VKGYLGEFFVDNHPYVNNTPADWALQYIQSYGGIDGAHHKDWVLDQVARILNGASITVVEARWEGGHSEIRFWVDTEVKCEKYEKWVANVREGEDGPETYGYEVGIAP